MRKVIVMFFVLFTAFCITGVVSATCMKDPVNWLVKQSDFVFSGKVTEIIDLRTMIGAFDSKNFYQYFQDPIFLVVEVKNTWKGNLPRKVILRVWRGEFASLLKNNSEWLIFAKDDHTKMDVSRLDTLTGKELPDRTFLSAYYCSGSIPLHYAADDLKDLGRPVSSYP